MNSYCISALFISLALHPFDGFFSISISVILLFFFILLSQSSILHSYNQPILLVRKMEEQRRLEFIMQRQHEEHQALQRRHSQQHQELLQDLLQKQHQEYEEMLQRHRLQQKEILRQKLLYHPPLHQSPQREQPILRGNLPLAATGSSSCRTVFVGNIHPHVMKTELEEFFSTAGSVESLELCQGKYTAYGFVDYVDHQYAAHAIETLNEKFLNEQPIIVNWSYSAAERGNMSTHFHIFVGDLGPEITNADLFRHFSQHPSFLGAKVIQDKWTGQSRSFGFVSFHTEQDALSAKTQFHRSIIGSRQIRCDWERQNRNVAQEKDGRNTTVYFSKLPFGTTENEVDHYFRNLGAGEVESVKILEDTNSGFVRFRTHAEAANAIEAARNNTFSGKHQIKCTWARSKQAW